VARDSDLLIVRADALFDRVGRVSEHVHPAEIRDLRVSHDDVGALRLGDYGRWLELRGDPTSGFEVAIDMSNRRMHSGILLGLCATARDRGLSIVSREGTVIGHSPVRLFNVLAEHQTVVFEPDAESVLANIEFSDLVAQEGRRPRSVSGAHALQAPTLIAVRQLLRLSRPDLAKQLGISVPELLGLEDGKDISPDIEERLARLAEAGS
jgi:hypothetical protein